MDAMASEITSLTIVYSTVYSGADQRKHQSSASLLLCVLVRMIYLEYPQTNSSCCTIYDPTVMAKALIVSVGLKLSVEYIYLVLYSSRASGIRKDIFMSLRTPHWDRSTLSQRQNGRHFADKFFKWIFLFKTFVFWFKFHRNLFPITITGSDNGLSLYRWQATI